MDSYRIEKRAVRAIRMSEDEEEIDPVPVGGGGHVREPELDLLSAIVAEFNDRWGGDGRWRDEDRVRRLITQDLPAVVRGDESFRNAQANSDGQNVRIEHDNALKRAVNGTIEDDMQFFKRFSDDESFRRWVEENTFRLVSSKAPPPPPHDGAPPQATFPPLRVTNTMKAARSGWLGAPFQTEGETCGGTGRTSLPSPRFWAAR